MRYRKQGSGRSTTSSIGHIVSSHRILLTLRYGSVSSIHGRLGNTSKKGLVTAMSIM